MMDTPDIHTKMAANESRGLEVDRLSVAFDTSRGVVNVVNDLSFALGRSQVMAILGESGSGKSVTLRALMRLLPHRAKIGGRIAFNGVDLSTVPEKRLTDIRGSEIAMIFQEPMSAFDPVYTVGQQIEETIWRHEGLDRQASASRARELFDLVQIPSAKLRLKAYPHELSGGLRQRAMIALALACRPKLLLADEPTTSLDVTVQIQILLLLRELQESLGMSMIFVTHDIGVAVEISERVSVMYAGRFVEEGPTSSIIRNPQHPYTIGLLRATVFGAQRGHRLEAIPGQPPDLSALPLGCAFAPRCKFEREECRQVIPPYLDVSSEHRARCIRVGLF